MHIPPYYKRPALQRFLAGICIGTIIGYLIFIYMFGELQEKWIEENLALRSKLQDLTQTYETLLENHQALDEQSKEGLQVNEIKINFLNLKELKLENDRLMIHELEEAIRTEANHAVGKNVEDIANSIDLLISTIENKTINIDDFRYQAEVSRVIVNETLQLSIRLKIGN
ncbi:sporulation membrane protein YtrI [Gracilibacillus massiliensis]|uniref:sporulation membrane protein YtrI n=1 Tax=Gracilibacillus massiliensis TaxID=1564956 RepID=UPI00071DF442|nr:sporulation membrane protein YtrI [Gracilibacillus massiliensis]